VRRVANVISIAWVVSSLAGCDFFRELESEDAGAETGTSGDSGDPYADCDLSDDYCEDQDRISSCDFSTGELSEVDCGVLCGSYINFTCTAVATGQHACWCVEAGSNKIDSCTQLEVCLADCGAGLTGSCGEKCFSRTLATTVRLYGALVHCAESECSEMCFDYPESCNSCLAAAKQGLYGDCGVERNVCDSDDNDDPDWP
jgi:hypothetical protein